MITQAAHSIRPNSGPQTRAHACSADVLFYGGEAGGGKTWFLTAEPLRHIHRPGFTCVTFRTSVREIKESGGLWDQASRLYPLCGGRMVSQVLDVFFPKGGRVSYRQMSHEQQRFTYDGSEIALLQFDEVQHRTHREFFHLLGRNRSTCGIRPYCRASCNPDADSWLVCGDDNEPKGASEGGIWGKGYISWWIGADGYPIPERDGVLRWQYRDEGKLYWADTREELLEQFPDATPDEVLSVTFIRARLEDNPVLLEEDPGYRAKLRALDRVTHARLAGGNWKTSTRDGAEWDDSYFPESIWCEYWPDEFETGVIALDPAKGKVIAKGKQPDYFANVAVNLLRGDLYVDSDLRRQPPEVMVEAALSMQEENPWCDCWVLEANAFQFLIEDVIERIARERGILCPAVELDTSTTEKTIRIKRLGPHLRRGRFFFRDTESNRLLVSQLKQFPNGDYDDGPDALEKGVRGLRHLLAGVGDE